MPLAAYASSRLVALVAVYGARFVLPGTGLVVAMTRWDSAFYLAIAEDGYPRSLPPADSPAPYTPLGFFPLFPLVVRGLAAVTGLGVAHAAVVVNTAAGAVAAVLVHRVVAEAFDRQAADRAVLLFCFFPGSYALTFAYSEGLFLACAAGCLLLLHRRRFWWAALVAGIGSAARPVGWVLALTCAFAVLMHWREVRDWKPLPSPALAVGGLVAFFAFLHVHTGDALAWQRAQQQGWDQRIAWSGNLLTRVGDYLTGPVNELNMFMEAATLVAVVPLGWALVRSRPPGTWLVFAGVGLVPSLVTTGVALAPRHLYNLFPLVIAPALAVKGMAFNVLLAVCAGLLAFLVFVMAGTTGATP